MKLKKWFAAVLALMLVLTGCGAVSETIDDSAIRADAEILLESFLADDYDACRAVLDENVSDEDLESIFPAIHNVVKELGGYEMTAVAWDRKVSKEQAATAIRYLIEGESGKYYLSVSKLDGAQKLSGFQIEAAEADAEPTTPTGPIHWVFTAIGAAVMIFVIWMVVDCARRKMKRKWLWLVLIICVTVILSLAVRGGELGFNFRIGLFQGMTSLTTFARGGFKVMIYVPLGAIIYFFKRKDLTVKEEQHVEGEEEAQE